MAVNEAISIRDYFLGEVKRHVSWLVPYTAFVSGVGGCVALLPGIIGDHTNADFLLDGSF